MYMHAFVLSLNIDFHYVSLFLVFFLSLLFLYFFVIYPSHALFTFSVVFSPIKLVSFSIPLFSAFSPYAYLCLISLLLPSKHHYCPFCRTPCLSLHFLLFASCFTFFCFVFLFLRTLRV